MSRENPLKIKRIHHVEFWVGNAASRIFYRHFMSEFMGPIRGEYEAKAEGFVPGGASLHNCMAGHGPDAATYERAIAADLKPVYLADTLAFLFETRFVCRPTKATLKSSELDEQYFQCWQGLEKRFEP